MALAAFTALGACSATPGAQTPPAAVCNEESAYAAGKQAAKEGLPMQPNFAARCRTGVEGLKRAYRAGYKGAPLEAATP